MSVAQQAATIPAPRTRNRGGNLEKWGWIYMRASGVLLIVLIFGHLFVNLMVGEGIHQIDFAFVAGKYASPFWQWWDVLMLWLASSTAPTACARSSTTTSPTPPPAASSCGRWVCRPRSSSSSARSWSSPSTRASA
jgi:hypothetical protein